MDLVWHYTTGELLDLIAADGFIRPATEGLEVGALDEETRTALEAIVASGQERAVKLPYKERPAVWFSKRPTWEPTATKGIFNPRTGERRTATIEEMMTEAGGLVRIGVRPEGLATWVEHRQVGRISAASARALVIAAREVGSNPGDWLVHYGPVPRERWIVVQRFDGAAWVDADGGSNP